MLKEETPLRTIDYSNIQYFFIFFVHSSLFLRFLLIDAKTTMFSLHATVKSLFPIFRTKGALLFWSCTQRLKRSFPYNLTFQEI